MRGDGRRLGRGRHLLRRVVAAYPEAARRVPGLRLVVVPGRASTRLAPAVDGLDIHSYVPDLYRHLAACDLAIVQGGLTTCMELTANRRPFIYVPLQHHFEQNFHVRHRLRALPGRPADGLRRPRRRTRWRRRSRRSRPPVDYLPVSTDGAARAAGLLADLL